MDDDTYRAAQQQTGVSPFWASKYASDSGKNWNKFYKRNKTNFYKDRHWTTRESTDGFTCLSQGSSIVVEAGCGVANLAFPLLQSNPSLFIYMFDFAASAIQLIHQNPQYNQQICHAFEWDFCKSSIQTLPQSITNGLHPEVANFVLLVFVLSAVPPNKQKIGLKHLFELLKPGGKLLFRDYATGDMAQSRFSTKNRINHNYFVRQDGTLSYFFDEQSLTDIMISVGFQKVYVRRVERLITNRKEDLQMNRVFLQAEFVKPSNMDLET